MDSQPQTHKAIIIAKRALDDLDIILSKVEDSTEIIKQDAKDQAEAALSRLHTSRSKLKNYYDQLRSEATSIQNNIADLRDALEDECVEVELAYQAFLSAAKNQAETARTIAVARARAQRESWEGYFDELRSQAENMVDKAQSELDTAIKHLLSEAEKFQTRIGDVKNIGDQSWTAVKTGLTEAKAAHDRTIEKIKDAFSKLF